MSKTHVVASGLLAAVATGSLLAQGVRIVQIDISSQPLNKALNVWAAQTGYQVMISEERAAPGRTAPPIKGAYTPEGALRILLATFDLKYQFVGDRIVAITHGDKVAAPREQIEPAHDQEKPGRELPLALAQSRPRATEEVATTGSVEQTRATAKGRGGIEEVVVTATRRAERLIDVPQSVSVLSADAISRLGATQFRDYANTIPGLNFTTAGAGFTQISMRGVTIGVDIGPTVGIYVDEVPYGASGRFYSTRLALDAALFDLDRIEVLRGPQGTLYGASSMGGLIKYVTKLPDTTTRTGAAQLGMSGTQDGGLGFNVGVAANLPIVTDKLAVRVSGFETRDGGYIDNLARGDKDVNRSDIYGGRADFLFTPTDKLSIRLAGFVQNIDREGEATVNFSRAGDPIYGDLTQYRPFAEPFWQRFRLASGTVNYEMPWATLTSISSYQTVRSQAIWDVSETYVPLLQSLLHRSYSAVSVPNYYSTDKFVQEIRLSGGKAGQRLQWVLGGFHTNESGMYKQQFQLLDLSGQPATNDLLNSSGPLTYRESAAFGDLTVHLTSKFDVTGGLRWANNRQVYTGSGTGLFLRPRPTSRIDQDVTTYLANARYHFTERSTTYVRYATGYRPGAPNANLIDPTTGQPLGALTFNADRIKSYEVGFKADTAGQLFGVDFAVYYNDWSNMQINVVRGGFGFIANSTSGATVRGGELTVNARPLDGLGLSGAFAYTDAHMTDADPDLHARAGERLPNVPRFTGALNADYAFGGEIRQPTLGATARYVSDRFSNFDANTSYPQHRFPAYATVDLRGGMTFGKVKAQFYVHNLFNKYGQLSVSSGNVGGIPVAILQPRTVGIMTSVQF